MLWFLSEVSCLEKVSSPPEKENAQSELISWDLTMRKLLAIVNQTLSMLQTKYTVDSMNVRAEHHHHHFKGENTRFRKLRTREPELKLQSTRYKPS